MPSVAGLPASRGRSPRQAPAVVVDREANLIAAGFQFDIDALRARVARHLGQRLLREEGNMKTSLLAIALAVATMPLTFAQAAPANPATTNGGATQATTTAKTKKHVKKSKKAPKKNSGATAATPSK